ncbi:MAG: hypothetical protein HQK69_01015 [Desulfamplus sp.]|nr:hypothetical protein [Desulfamplus sp.]
MKKTLAALCCCGLFLTAPENSFCDQTIYAIKTPSPPVIDGNADDISWQGTKNINTHDNIADININLKAVYDDKKIYFLVVFPDIDESRSHKTWIWNAKNNGYEIGPDREDTFIFKWNMENKQASLSIHSDNPHIADIWFWKADRTDPLGFADDKMDYFSEKFMLNTMELISNAGKHMFLKRTPDKGYPAYQTTLPVDYAGDKIPHYSSQKPIGSRADVSAKGIWSKNEWTIEFSRKLKTGNLDDLQFNIEDIYYFGVSRYEIAGIKPNPEISQPLYGAGDTSELLTLKFISK